MELTLYDTLRREKRVFAPLDRSRVRMYVCGPTVYDFAHIGNARPVIVFDVLFRLLRHLYGQDAVTYVRNITDVDDKINARAAERGVPIRELTEETYRNFKEDVAALGCLAPTVEPRATEHIEEMKTLIERLIASGNAYVGEDHVLFSVPSMPDYGKLSKRSLDEMVAGARVDVAPYKRGDMDFVLWKPSKEGEPGWPSPAGIATPGRPGWHIECSAMAWKHLGETFDIHGGGIDLEFPHHENEIAQSRCAFHTPLMANYWVHNGFLQVEGQKMSKSLGNFVTIRDVLKNWKGQAWSGKAVRLAMLETHYRQPINWTYEKLYHADMELFRFTSSVFAVVANRFNNNVAAFAEFMQHTPRQPLAKVISALKDDLNTPAALSVLRGSYDKMTRDPQLALDMIATFEFLGLAEADTVFFSQIPMIRNVFDQNDLSRIAGLGKTLLVNLSNKNTAGVDSIKKLLETEGVEIKHLGLGLFLLERAPGPQVGLIESLIAARSAAKQRKDWDEADRIRKELAAMAIELIDFKDGTTEWRTKR